MRARVSLTLLCLVGTAYAQDAGLLGTKASPISTSSSPGGMGVMPLVQMAIALAVVLFLLKFILPRIVGKMNKKLVTSATSMLKIEESASFARGTLYIVRARSKTLLLSVSTQGVNCLADITEEDAKPEEKTAFEKIIDSAPGDRLPDTAVIEQALNRLERLAT